ncbi:hypothetical protein EV121DRAFT_274277 [Schizophyllum commune]
MAPKTSSKSKKKGHAATKKAEKEPAKKDEQAPKGGEEVETSQPDEKALAGGVGASVGAGDPLRSQATEESSDMPFPLTQPRTKTALIDSASELTDPDESNEEEGGVPGGDKKGTDPDAEGETDDEDGDEPAEKAGAPAAQKRASKAVKNPMDVDSKQSQDQPPAPSGQGQFGGEESGGNAGEAGKEDSLLQEGKNAGFTNEGNQGSGRDAMDVDLPSATGAGKGASVKSTAAQGEPPRPVRRVPGTGPRSVRAPKEPSPTVAAVGTAPAPTGVNVSTPGAVASGASANVPPGTDQAALDDVSSIKPVKKSKSSKKNKKKGDKEDSDKEESANDEFSKVWYLAQLGYSTVPCVDDAEASPNVASIKPYDHLQRDEDEANVDRLAAKGLGGLMRMLTEYALEVIVDPDLIDPNSYCAQPAADLPILAKLPGVEDAAAGLVQGFHRRAAHQKCWVAAHPTHAKPRVWTDELKKELKKNGCWMVRVWNKKVLESSPCGSAVIQVLRNNNKTQEMKDHPARRAANMCRALLTTNEVGAEKMFKTMITADKIKTAFDIVLGNLSACRSMMMYLACISQYTESTHAIETYFPPEKWLMFGRHWGELVVQQPGVSAVFSRILAIATDSLAFFQKRVDISDKASVKANNEQLADLYNKLTPLDGIASHRLTASEQVFAQLLSDATEDTVDGASAAHTGFEQSLVKGVLTGWRDHPGGVEKMRDFYSHVSSRFDTLVDGHTKGPNPTIAHPDLVKTAFYNICMSELSDEDGLGPLRWTTSRLPLACPRVVRSILDAFTTHTRLNDASIILTFVGNLIAPGSITLKERMRPRVNHFEHVEHTPLFMVQSFVENIRLRELALSRKTRSDEWDKETRATAERVACRIADGVLAYHGAISISDVVQVEKMNEKYERGWSGKDKSAISGGTGKGGKGKLMELEVPSSISIASVHDHLNLLVSGWNDMCLVHSKELRLLSHPTVSKEVLDRYNSAKGKLSALNEEEDKLMRRAAEFLTVFPVDPFKRPKGTGSTYRKQNQEDGIIPCAIQYAALAAELLGVLNSCPLLVRLYNDICNMLADDGVLGEKWLPWPKMDSMRPSDADIQAASAARATHVASGDTSGTHRRSRSPSDPPSLAELTEIPAQRVIIESNLRNRGTSLAGLPMSLTRGLAKVYQDCQLNTTRGNYTLSEDMIGLLKLVNKQAIQDTYRFYGGEEAHGAAMRAKEESMNAWLDEKVKALTEEEAKAVQAAVDAGVSDEAAAQEKKEKAAEKKRSASTSAKDGGRAKRARVGKKDETA